MYPKIIIDCAKLRTNLETLSRICSQGGCSMMAVTKGFCADPDMVDEILSCSGVDYLADSRVRNLQSYADKARMAGKETVLLRLPQASEIEGVVSYADISLNSEISIIRMLDEEAGRQRKKHKIILMVDMGDLREGIFFENEEEIMAVCGEILKMENVLLHGVGVNLTCYGAIIPKEDNLGSFVELAKRIEDRFAFKFAIISGGNSSSIYLIPEGKMPDRINNLRLGESYILGNETAYGERIEGTYNDALVLRAQLIEVKKKPSLPIGEVGVDAFGEVPVYEDKGEMLRGIVALGKQDTVPGGLVPRDAGIEVLGASSDHLILDLTNAKGEYEVGDTVDFVMEYGAMLGAFTSPYVARSIV